jgi:hypothetical protein
MEVTPQHLMLHLLEEHLLQQVAFSTSETEQWLIVRKNMFWLLRIIE